MQGKDNGEQPCIATGQPVLHKGKCKSSAKPIPIREPTVPTSCSSRWQESQVWLHATRLLADAESSPGFIQCCSSVAGLPTSLSLPGKQWQPRTVKDALV